MPFKLTFAEPMEIPTAVHNRLKPVRLKKALTKITYHSLSKKNALSNKGKVAIWSRWMNWKKSKHRAHDTFFVSQESLTRAGANLATDTLKRKQNWKGNDKCWTVFWRRKRSFREERLEQVRKKCQQSKNNHKQEGTSIWTVKYIP